MKRKIILFAVLLLAVVALLAACGKEPQTQAPTAETPTTEAETPETLCTVTFNTGGGSAVPSQSVKKGEKATKPADPEKAGYVFAGWTYQGEAWSFISFTVTENITLEAKWDSAFTVSGNTVTELTVAGKTLTAIVIPSEIDGVAITGIGRYAFQYCTSLKSITIPNNVTSIGDYAFRDCTGLTCVYYTGDIAGWCGIAFGDYDANPMFYAHNLYINNQLVTGELVIPDSVTSIGRGAFSNCTGLTNVTIGNSVTSIGYKAFYDCTGLTSITIGNSVTSIGDSAFSGCTGLTSVTISNSVTRIGYGAFCGCSALKSMTIPFVGAKAGVTSSDTYQYPFGYIFGTSSYTGGTATEQRYYKSESSTPPTTTTTYYIPSSLKSVTVTGGNILYGAFSNCTGLTSITIPNSVTSIGGSAFSGCTNLQYNTYDNAKYLGNEQNPYMVLVEVTSADITSCNIHADTKVIFDSAFRNCTGLTSITIPNSVTSIGWGAFRDCTSLKSITIPNSVTSIGDSAFAVCTGLMNVIIGNSVESIGAFAFFSCTGLTSVTIGSGVTTIGSSAFDGCAGLKSITYQGTKAQWNAISKGPFWNRNNNTGSYTIHCTDGDLVELE